MTPSVAEEIWKMAETVKHKYFSDFARKYYAEGIREGHEQGIQEGRAEGIQEGRAEGQRRMLQAMLSQRGFELTAEEQRLIDDADLPTLETWAMRLLNADSAIEVFEDS